MKNKSLTFLIFLCCVLIPSSTYAHLFVEVDLPPLPPSFYLYGGTASVLFSFFIMAFFVKVRVQNLKYPIINLSKIFGLRYSPVVKNIIAIISVGIFLYLIICGYFGDQADPDQNPLIVFFWIYLLLGLTYASALLGNVWNVINPWNIVAGLFPEKQLLSYPKSLSYYPALVFYIGVISVELIFHTVGTDPRTLSIILIVYTIENLLGSKLFGRKTWFTHCEFFSVLFGLVSKMSPFQYSNGEVHLFPPFVKLLREKVPHISLLFFILFTLSSTMFDGFRETAAWSFISANTNNTFELIFLMAALFILASIYFIAQYILKFITKTNLSLKELALRFGFSLVPIGIAYNIAHYYTILLAQGHWMLPVEFVWVSQVLIIVLGHIIATCMAHLIATYIFKSHRLAVISQIPMIILMVVYTFFGLWILAHPMV